MPRPMLEDFDIGQSLVERGRPLPVTVRLDRYEHVNLLMMKVSVC
jgi:hypothetical protein